MRNRIAGEYVRYMIDKVRYYETLSHALFERQISQILLIHANTINADHLDGLLSALRDEGYAFTSLGETLRDSAYQSENTYSGNAGISWLQRWAITANKGRELFSSEPATPEYILDYAAVESE